MAERKKHSARTPLLEWVAAGIGLSLLLGLLGVIGWEALRGGPSQPPAIEVAVSRIAASGAGFVVEFEARNRAGSAAQSVEIEGVLSGGGPPETRSISFDYIPGHSRRGGGLFFSRDPRQGRLELRAHGFQTP